MPFHKKYGIRKERQFKKDFIELYRATNFDVSKSLTKLGLTRYYYDKWLAEDVEFKLAIENSKKMIVDWVESKLFELIKRGDRQSILFYLKTHSDEYIEKNVLQQDIKMDPISFIITPPKQIEGGDDIKKLEE